MSTLLIVIIPSKSKTIKQVGSEYDEKSMIRDKMMMMMMMMIVIIIIIMFISGFVLGVGGD